MPVRETICHTATAMVSMVCSRGSSYGLEHRAERAEANSALSRLASNFGSVLLVRLLDVPHLAFFATARSLRAIRLYAALAGPTHLRCGFSIVGTPFQP